MPIPSDPTRGLDEKNTKDMDIKKGVKNASSPDAAEQVIEGATPDALKEFAEFDRATVEKPTGIVAKLKRVFGRG